MGARIVKEATTSDDLVSTLCKEKCVCCRTELIVPLPLFPDKIPGLSGNFKRMKQQTLFNEKQEKETDFVELTTRQNAKKENLAAYWISCSPTCFVVFCSHIVVA